MSPAPQVPVGVSSPTESLVATGFRTSHTPLATAGPRTDVPGSESGRVWVGGRQGPSLVGDGGLPCPFRDFSGRVGRRAITLRTHTQLVGCVARRPIPLAPGGGRLRVGTLRGGRLPPVGRTRGLGVRAPGAFCGSFYN